MRTANSIVIAETRIASMSTELHKLQNKKHNALKRILCTILLTSLICSLLTGQTDSLAPKVYHLKHAFDIPFTIVFAFLKKFIYANL